MCLSRLGQLIYGVLSVVVIGLIAASMFTPGWRSFNENLTNNGSTADVSFLVNKVAKLNFGSFFCQIPSNTNASTAPDSNSNDNSGSAAANVKETFENIAIRTAETCSKWFEMRPTWEKVVISAMILALLTALLAFIWNLFSFCACFCKGGILKPLPGLAGLTALLLGVALTIFYYNNINYIKEMKSTKIHLNGDNLVNNAKNTTQEIYAFIQSLDENGNRVSYSFYLACGAAFAAFANVIVGTLTVCLADKWL